MTRQWRAVPTYTEQLVQKGNTSASYYRLLQDLHTGNPAAAESPVDVTGSPFTYVATQGGAVIVNGGTVSQIAFVRTQTYITGQTAGMFPIGAGDKLIITYSVVPSVVFAPR